MTPTEILKSQKRRYLLWHVHTCSSEITVTAREDPTAGEDPTSQAQLAVVANANVQLQMLMYYDNIQPPRLAVANAKVQSSQSTFAGDFAARG